MDKMLDVALIVLPILGFAVIVFFFVRSIKKRKEYSEKMEAANKAKAQKPAETNGSSGEVRITRAIKTYGAQYPIELYLNDEPVGMLMSSESISVKTSRADNIVAAKGQTGSPIYDRMVKLPFTVSPSETVQIEVEMAATKLKLRKL